MEIKTNTLYLVGTPIGNLSDMTYRAVEVLQKVDFIAAEDTRNALKLLNHFDIKKPLVSYFEHNKRERGEMIAQRILQGESCALITDAGMPAISDPGEDLAALCHEKGILVSPIPGACAAVCALATSGMPSGRFCFEGFLSTSTKSRKEHLAALVKEERTMIFYEAPHKLLSTLKDMETAWGDRKLVIARELTKIYEEIEVTTLFQAVQKYTDKTPKGEFVLVVAGKGKEIEDDQLTDEQARQVLEKLLETGMTKKEAIREAVAITGRSRNELYAFTIE